MSKFNDSNYVALGNLKFLIMAKLINIKKFHSSFILIRPEVTNYQKEIFLTNVLLYHAHFFSRLLR